MLCPYGGWDFWGGDRKLYGFGYFVVSCGFGVLCRIGVMDLLGERSDALLACEI
jgi:hypothetical protein